MRLFIILSSLLLIAATGVCTGEYIERADNHQPGIIQDGDVFEFYCELPSMPARGQSLLLRVSYPNAQLFESLFVPRTLRVNEVLFP